MTFSPIASLVCACSLVCGRRGRQSRAANEDRDIHDNYQLKLSEPQCSQGLTVQPRTAADFPLHALRRNQSPVGVVGQKLPHVPLSFAPLWIYGWHCVRVNAGASTAPIRRLGGSHQLNRRAPVHVNASVRTREAHAISHGRSLVEVVLFTPFQPPPGLPPRDQESPPQRIKKSARRLHLLTAMANSRFSHSHIHKQHFMAVLHNL